MSDGLFFLLLQDFLEVLFLLNLGVSLFNLGGSELFHFDDALGLFFLVESHVVIGALVLDKRY